MVLAEADPRVAAVHDAELIRPELQVYIVLPDREGLYSGVRVAFNSLLPDLNLCDVWQQTLKATHSPLYKAFSV